MSQLVNTRYGRLLRDKSLEPVYVAEIEGLPYWYSTGPVKSPTTPTRAYLSAVMGAGAQITVDEGRSSLASLTLSILDKEGEITRLAFLYQLANRMVTIRQGFQSDTYASYVIVFKGRILDYTLEKDNITWTMQVVSLLKDQKQEIFKAVTALTAPIGPADVTINVTSTAKFPNATGGVLYLKIEDEVISYTGKTATSFTGCARGQMSTAAAAHATETEVVNLVKLVGNPLTLALQIMTSTGNGTNGAYDVLPACAGLAIDESLIDIARFERERDRWLSYYTFTFEEIEAVNGKEFLEEQLYTFCNAYPIIMADGKIGIKVYAPPLPSTIAAELTDDDLIGPPNYRGNVLQTMFFNEVDLQYDWNFRTQEFETRALYEDSTSQATFQTVKTWQRVSRGIRSGNGAGLMSQIKIDNFATRVLKRFSTPSPILEAQAMFSQRLIEAGDVVPLTSAFVPNLATGKRGINQQLMEVISIDPDYLGASQRFGLLNTGYSYGRKYAAISPSAKAPFNFPNFTAATTAQKQYAFISQKVTNTRGVMSDGSDGYYISP